jgi:urease accessory protein
MHRAIPRGLVAALALFPTAAFAHTGAGATHGFLDGFSHPIGGVDHVLAMVTIGLFAFQLGGRALWAVPATFVAAMGLGGLLGAAGFALPQVELGIALSVAALGTLVATGAKTPVAPAMALAGVFAVFHGHAHGSEMPAAASALGYGAGFLLATALLHATGLGLGFVAARISQSRGRLAFQATGSVIAVAGLAMLGGVI